MKVCPAGTRFGYDKDSNVPAADKTQGKLVHIRNFEHDNVRFQNSLPMTNAPQQAGMQLNFIHKKAHGAGRPVCITMHEGMIEFFDRNLKGK